jgi:lipoprotein-anchoring transpeptidase ErfK/SrfK
VITRMLAAAAALALCATAGCRVNVEEGDNAAGTNAATAQQQQAPRVDPRIQQMRDQARQQVGQLRFLVDISDRKVRVFQGNRLLREHDAAVGTSEWPTPTGSWNLHRVDLNPEWNPPREEWAEEEEAKAPGDPENPMGRARLVYRMPNTIHGTNDVASLGKASSHGSVRVANEAVLQLAELLLKAGGAWDGPQWFGQMVQTPTREFQIPLPQPVRIVVQE